MAARQEKQMKRRILLLLLCSLFLVMKILSGAIPVFAVIVETDRDEFITKMVEKSDYIVIGTVIGSASKCSKWTEEGPKNIYTIIDFDVEKVLKGNITTELLQLTVEGGQIGDYMLDVSYEPSFRVNDRVLLFLCSIIDGTKEELRVYNGKLGVMYLGGDRLVIEFPSSVKAMSDILWCVQNGELPVQAQSSELAGQVITSDHVIMGIVTGVENGEVYENVPWPPGWIGYKVSVDKILKGDVEPEIMVRADTGPISSIEDWLWDVPVLEESDKVVLFLKKGIDGYYSVVGGQRSVLYLESEWYEPVENQSDVICSIVSIMRENDIPVMLSKADLAECRTPFPVWAIVAIVCVCLVFIGVGVWYMRIK